MRFRKSFAPLVALLVLSMAGAAPQEGDLYEGEIVSLNVAEGEMMMTCQTEQVTFKVTPETKISFDGKPAELNELGVGNSAKVVAKKDVDKIIATSIDATSIK